MNKKFCKRVGTKIVLLFLPILSFSISNIQAQEAIIATGGNASGTGGTASYSVGQVVYLTNSGANGSEIQGVQQPFEISTVAEIENAKTINIICSAYPNPTNDLLIINIDNYNKDNLSYQLYDITGKSLESKKVESNVTSISMKSFLPGIYFLKITDNNNEIKIFKIIKN